MKSFKYFHINNIKFNYTLEFQSNQKLDHWKHNAPLIEYCETVGITIPHYCYHKSLSISGNCRMCLVELKNSPKPIVSCAMSAKSCLNNSEVYTNSPLVKKARENVLEFLLLNHPLDCPVCDQGGECDLQEQSFFFGMSKKRFYNFKRVVMDKNLGPIVKTVMTRCIHCTRCVRFAREIAGVLDLGMFGRGINSEIGTYVQKTFQSELSGNVIELCPVGALTSKLYPFVSRNWELKNVSSIDFSDGFGSDLSIYLKNNKIVKISPGYNKNANEITWISDKTRFSFDGMFSPERVLEGFIVHGNKTCKISLLWDVLLSEIINTLYFQDHLNKHFLQIKYFSIIFNSNVSLEVLNLLVLFSKKYAFIKLRKTEGCSANNDLEHNILLNSIEELTGSSLCFLFGVNARYEGSYLNLKLRQRYLKGGFKVVSVGSSLDLTFPVSYSGVNINTIKSLCEGNSFLCQEVLNSSNPMVIVSSEISKRKDYGGLNNLLKLKNNFHYKKLSVLSTSLNEVGVNYLQGFKSVNELDISESSGLYFLNSSVSSSSKLQKIINLKLLKYTDGLKIRPMFCLEHNNSMITNISKSLLSNYSVYNYINLPNNTFFESSGTYINTQGFFKKVFKFLPSVKQTKEDWQIIRKLFSYSKKINFTANYKFNNLVQFNNNTINNYKNFIGFLYFANQFFYNNHKDTFNKNVSGNFDIKEDFIKQTKTKILLTNIKIWIKDFYIGGEDCYSNRSVTMINCSKLHRSQKSNFNIVSVYTLYRLNLT